MKKFKVERAVVARIFGGLGNQMFQYACGRALSLRNGVPLRLDLGWFDDQGESTLEAYGLDIFSIEAETAGREETAL